MYFSKFIQLEIFCQEELNLKNNENCNSESVNLDEIMESVIKESDQAVQAVKKTFFVLQKLTKLKETQQNVAIRIISNGNMSKAKEDLKEAIKGMTVFDAVLLDALRALIKFRLEQRTIKKGILLFEELEEAMGEVIEVKLNTSKIIGVARNELLQRLKEVSEKNKNTSCGKLLMAKSKILEIIELSICNSKDGFVFLKASIDFLENNVLSDEITEERIKENKKALLMAKTALIKIKDRIEVEDEQQLINLRKDISSDELRNIVENIVETRSIMKSLVKIIIKILKNSFECQNDQDSHEFNHTDLEKVASWGFETIKPRAKAKKASIKIYSDLKIQKIFNEEAQEIPVLNEFCDTLEHIKDIRDEVVEIAKKVHKYLEEQEVIQIVEGINIGEENDLSYGKSINRSKTMIDNILRAKNDCKTTLDALKGAIKAEDDLQIKLMDLTAIVLQTLNDLIDIVLSNLHEYHYRREIEEYLGSSVNYILKCSMIYCLANNSKNLTDAERKTADEEFEIFTTAVNRIYKGLPYVKESVHKVLFEKTQKLMTVMGDYTKMTNELLSTEDFAEKIIDSLRTITEMQKTKKKIYKSTKDTILRKVKTVRTIKTQMNNILTIFDSRGNFACFKSNDLDYGKMIKAFENANKAVEELEKLNIYFLESKIEKSMF